MRIPAGYRARPLDTTGWVEFVPMEEKTMANDWTQGTIPSGDVAQHFTIYQNGVPMEVFTFPQGLIDMAAAQRDRGETPGFSFAPSVPCACPGCDSAMFETFPDRGRKGGSASAPSAPSLQSWLETLQDMCEVRPVEVTIAGTVYQGCEYWQRAMPPKGSRTEGQEYVIHALYILADRLPACYRRSSHVAFPRSDDRQEWYIAGYSAELDEKRPGKCSDPAKYQPFGPAVYLHPWDVPSGEKIDYHEDKSYRRMPMEVRYLVADGSVVAAEENLLHPDPLNNPGNIGGFYRAGEIYG